MTQRDIYINIRGAEPGSPEHAAMVTAGRDADIQSALAWLAFSHLPSALRRFSAPFYSAAVDLLRQIEQDVPELKEALKKLIEAKDAGVRAGIHAGQGRPGPVPRPQEVVDPPVLPGAGA